MKKTSKIVLLAMAALLALTLAGCQRPVAELKLDTSAVKTELAFNEDLDLSGLIVTAVYEDGTEAVVPASDYTVDQGGFQKDKAGTYTITVTAHEKQASFQVTVAEFVRAETGFRVDRSSVLNVYGYGSDVDFSGVQVYAVFNDGSEELLEASAYDLDDSAFKNDEVGTYTITVTYKDYAPQTFTVQIVAAGDSDSVIYDGDTRIMFSTVNYTFSVSSDQTVTFTAENGAVTKVECVAGQTYPYPKLENGDYEMSYVSSSGEPTVRKLRFVDRVSALSYGPDYALYLNTLGNLGQEGSDFLDTEADPYEVGTADSFLFDVELLGDGAASIDFSLDVLKLTFEILEDGAFVAAPEDLAVIEGNEVFFGSAYAGRTVRVSVESRYTEQDVLTFEFLLNDGVNVFTHKQMEAAYGSFNVHCINLHRNLVITEADLDDDQFFWVDGEKCCIKNLGEGTVLSSVEYDAEGNLTKNATGNLYVRVSQDKTGDHLTVNGNYFTIDITALETFKVHTDANHPGNSGNLNNTGELRQVVNSQTGVFWSYVRGSSAHRSELETQAADTVDDSGATLVDGSKAVFDEGEDNWLSFANLSIKGNTSLPTDDQIAEDGGMEVIYANSGAYCGFRTYYTDMTAENVSIYGTVVPFSAIGLGADTDLTACYLRESWANNVYSYNGSDVTITDSVLTTAGGAAVWLEDRDHRSGSVFNSNLTLENTVIENLVAGNEPWFAAWNLTMVGSMKAAIESSVNTFSKSEKTIIQEKTVNNQPSQCFNFAVVITEIYDEVGNEEGAFKSAVTIDGHTVQHNRNALANDDVRKNSTATFIPFGDLSLTNDFLAAVAELVPGLMQGGMDLETAQVEAVNQLMYQSILEAEYIELALTLDLGDVGRMTAYLTTYDAQA